MKFASIVSAGRRMAARLGLVAMALAWLNLTGAAEAVSRGADDGATTSPASRIKSEPVGGREIVVAEVGEETLTLRELKRLMQPLLKAEMKSRDVDPEKTPDSYLALTRAVEERIVAEWLSISGLNHLARENGLTVSEEEVAKALDEIQDSIGASDNSIVALARESGFDPVDFEKTIRAALLGDKYVRLCVEKSIPDEKLRAAYDKDPERYVIEPHQRQVHYFSVARREEISSRLLRDAIIKAQERIVAGEDTATVYADLRQAEAKLLEEAVSAQRMTTDQLQAILNHSPAADAYDILVTEYYTFPTDKLTKAAFELPIGQTSPVISSDVGYHFLKVVDDRPARGVTFEECRPVIIEALMNEHRWNLSMEALRKLKQITVVHRRFLTPTAEDEEESDSQMTRRLEDAIRQRGLEGPALKSPGPPPGKFKRVQ